MIRRITQMTLQGRWSASMTTSLKRLCFYLFRVVETDGLSLKTWSSQYGPVRISYQVLSESPSDNSVNRSLHLELPCFSRNLSQTLSIRYCAQKLSRST